MSRHHPKKLSCGSNPYVYEFSFCIHADGNVIRLRKTIHRAHPPVLGSTIRIKNPGGKLPLEMAITGIFRKTVFLQSTFYPIRLFPREVELLIKRRNWHPYPADALEPDG